MTLSVPVVMVMNPREAVVALPTDRSPIVTFALLRMLKLVVPPLVDICTPGVIEPTALLEKVTVATLPVLMPQLELSKMSPAVKVELVPSTRSVPLDCPLATSTFWAQVNLPPLVTRSVLPLATEYASANVPTPPLKAMVEEASGVDRVNAAGIERRAGGEGGVAEKIHGAEAALIEDDSIAELRASCNGELGAESGY